MKQFLTTALAVVAVALSAQTTNVTFQVDMNDYTGSFTTPEVNGTFNSWCGACNAMTDPDGDDIWTVTLPLATGSSIEYKFSHDAWAGQEQNDPTAPCTNGNATYTNRVWIVTGDTTLPAVCWASCNVCGLGTEENSAALFTLTPNPSADVAVLNATEAGTVEVVNVAGAVVARQAVVAGENRIETSVLANGIYTVRWTNGRESSAARLAVRH